MMTINLNTLIKAINTLEYSLYVADEHIDEICEELRDTVKAGIIQHFGVAYEQCWKAMQQWIRANQPQEKTAQLSTRKELFRKAALYGLISDPQPWIKFADVQSAFSQTYYPDKVIFLYETAEKFRPYASELLDRLQQKNV